MTKNLLEIGISRDPNENVPSSKQRRVQTIKLANGFIEEEDIDEEKPAKPTSMVVQQLEQEANEYRESQFRYGMDFIKSKFDQRYLNN